MSENVYFKKFEVIGTTKDEAISAAKPLNLRVDATQAYKKWSKENPTNEENVKEWMKDYLAKKKFTMENDGAYIVLQSAVVDTRQRPYKEIKHKHASRTHSFERFYVVRNRETNEEVGCEKTSKAAIALAKEWVADNHQTVDIFVEAKVKEKNALYSTVEYTPAKGTQKCKLLAFGYASAE